jgi:hypothetical protein
VAGTSQNRVIRISINGAGAQQGATQVNSALNSIGQSARQANSQLSQLITSFGNVGGAAAGMTQAANAANNNTRATASSVGALGQAANAAMRQLSGMSGTLGGIALAGAALGVAAGVGGLIAFGYAAVSASAKFAEYRASLATVLGSTEQASIAFDKMAKFAAKTPFSLDQAVGGFIKLKALGLEPSEAALMSYGNTASAMGKDLNQMVEAVADASTGEFERLKEFGIKSSKQGNDVSFTFQGVTTKVKNNSTEIQNYLRKIGDVNFAGAMTRQAATFSGAMSNLSDTWTQTMAKVGDGGLTTAMGKVVTMITDGLGYITPLLVGIGNAMAGIISGVVSVVSGFASAFSALTDGGSTGIGLMETLSLTFNAIGFAAETFGSIVGAVFGAVGSAIGSVAGWLRESMGGAVAATGVNFSNGGRSWSNSIFGVLNAVRTVVGLMPNLFAIAINDISRMFRSLGTSIGAALKGAMTGDFSGFNKDLGAGVKASFANTTRALNAAGRIGNHAYEDRGAATAMQNKWLGRDAKTGGNLNPYVAPKPSPTAGKDDKDGAKAAAEKLKRENEFWQTMKDELVTAGLFGIEAQKFTKEKELHKILERDITDLEKSRIATAVQDIANAKAITGIKQQTFELQNEYLVNSQRGVGLTEAQRAVEDALFKARVAGLNAGADINSAAYKLAERDYALQLDKNRALADQTKHLKEALDTVAKYSPAYAAALSVADLDKERQNFIDQWNANGGVIDGKVVTKTVFDSVMEGMDKARIEAANTPFKIAIDYAKDAVKTDGTVDERRGVAQAAYDKTIKGLGDALANGKVSASEFRAGVNKAGHDLQEQFDTIGTMFTRKMSALGNIFDRLAQSIGGKAGEAFGAGRDITDALGSFDKTKNDISDSLTNAFGKNSGLIKGIGTAVGGAMAGMGIGESIAGLGKAIGLKTSKTGGQIGGAIGGAAFGPIGAAVGGTLGSIIGGLFKKPKEASATFSVVDGQVVAGAGKGNGKAAIGTATALAGDVASGINEIASQLGASIGSLGVSVGYRPGHKAGAYRVDETGAGKLTGVAAFETQAEAVAYAIKTAIAQGALTGLPDLINKAIKSMDIDSAIEFAGQWKSLMADFDSMTDPIGSAVRSIIDPLKAMRATMVSVGASTEDLTKIDTYRDMKLKEALKSQLSSINDFMKALKGEGSGATQVSRLEADMAEFKSYQDRIAAGDSSVDQSAFTSLGQEIFGLAKDVYGTATSQFQDIRSMLTSTSQNLVDNVTADFNSAAGITDATSIVASQDATTKAIAASSAAQVAATNAQTNAVVAELAVMKSYMAQTAANTEGGMATYSAAMPARVDSINGRYVGSAV